MDTEKYLLLLRKLMTNYNEEYQTLVTQFSAYIRLTTKYLSQEQKKQFAAEIEETTIPSGKILPNPWMDEIYLLKVVSIFKNKTGVFDLPNRWRALYTDISGRNEWQATIKNFQPHSSEDKTEALFNMQDKIEHWLHSYSEPDHNTDKPSISQKDFGIILAEIKKRTLSRLFINNADELAKTMLIGKQNLENLLALTTEIKIRGNNDIVTTFLNQYHQLMVILDNIIRLLTCHKNLLNKLQELHFETQFADKYFTIIKKLDPVLERIYEAVDIYYCPPTHPDLAPLEELVRSLHEQHLITTVNFGVYRKAQRPKNTHLDKKLDFLKVQYNSINFSRLYKQLLRYTQLISSQLTTSQIDMVKNELSDKKIPFYGVHTNPWQQEVELIQMIEKQVNNTPVNLHEHNHSIFSLITDDIEWDTYAHNMADKPEYIMHAQQILELDNKIHQWLNNDRDQDTQSPRSILGLFSPPMLRRRSSVVSSPSTDNHLRSDSSGSFSFSSSSNSINSDGSENTDPTSQEKTLCRLPPNEVEQTKINKTRAINFRRYSVEAYCPTEPSSPPSPKPAQHTLKARSHSLVFMSSGFSDQFAELQINTIIKSLELNNANLEMHFNSIKPIVSTLKRMAEIITQKNLDLKQLQTLLVEIRTCSTQRLYYLKDNYQSTIDQDIVEFIAAYNQFSEYANQISTTRIMHSYLSRSISDHKYEDHYAFKQQRKYLANELFSDLEEIREIDSADKTHIISPKLRATGIERIIKYLNSYALFNIPRLINKEIAQRYDQGQDKITLICPEINI